MLVEYDETYFDVRNCPKSNLLVDFPVSILDSWVAEKQSVKQVDCEFRGVVCIGPLIVKCIGSLGVSDSNTLQL